MSIQWASFEVGVAGGPLSLFWEAMSTKEIKITDTIGIRFLGNVIPQITEAPDCITLRWSSPVEIILPKSIDPNIKFIEIRRQTVLIFLTIGHVKVELKPNNGGVLYETKSQT